MSEDQPTSARPEDGNRPKRRTQAERRTETINKILDASITCLCEMGYAKASTIQIARTAGVSQGAIFRHFDSRVALMSATGVQIANRFLDLLPNALEGAIDPVERRQRGWAFLRWVCGHPNYLAMHELTDGARSDPELSARLAPTWAALISNLSDAAWELGWPAGISREDVEAHVFVAFWLWDGWSRIRRISGDGDRQFVVVADQLESKLIASIERSLSAFS